MANDEGSCSTAAITTGAENKNKRKREREREGEGMIKTDEMDIRFEERMFLQEKEFRWVFQDLETRYVSRNKKGATMNREKERKE